MASLKDRLTRVAKRLDMYYAAEEAVLSGAQSYSLGSRTLTRADLAEIRKVIAKLEDEVDMLQSAVDGNGARRCVRALPRDI
jgi:hypothetical protein